MSVALEVRQDASCDAVGAKHVAPVARTACVSSRSARCAGIVLGVVVLLVPAAILFSESDAAGDAAEDARGPNRTGWVDVRAAAEDSNPLWEWVPSNLGWLALGFLEAFVGNGWRCIQHNKSPGKAVVKTSVEEAIWFTAIALSKSLPAIAEVILDIIVHIMAAVPPSSEWMYIVAILFSGLTAFPFAAFLENVADFLDSKGWPGTPWTIGIWVSVHVISGVAAPVVFQACGIII
jgi:hypothetical protein